MRRELFRTGVLVALSASAGWIGWSGHVLLLPVAAAFPMLWSLARARLQAMAVSAAYLLSASRGLPQGVANFYSSDIWPGLLLWLVASSVFVAVHAMLWTDRKGWLTPLRYIAANFAMAVPPFGILGWAHPITAAGVLFPDWGWWGIAATAAGLMGLVTRQRPAAIAALSGAWLWSAMTWSEPVLPDRWQGVDLRLGASLGRDVSMARHRDLIAMVRETASRGPSLILLPESALGHFTPTVDRLWRRSLAGTHTVVVAGAVKVDRDGYDSLLVEMSADRSVVLYRQRMPVPASMWQPWMRLFGQGAGAHADIFGNPVVRSRDTLIAPLICYEQLLVWPVLHSMLSDPDVILAVGNGWWTSGTSIVDIQRAAVIAWARLFSKPLVASSNR